MEEPVTIFRRRLKQEGLIVITADKRKIVFVVLFSILLIVLSLAIGYLLKLPLIV
jgi:hypothetical protein